MNFDDAILFHEREEQRMLQVVNRRWIGRRTRDAYAEAAYAHNAALIHLRKLHAEPTADAPTDPRLIGGGATHNFEFGPGAEDYDSVRTFGFGRHP